MFLFLIWDFVCKLWNNFKNVHLHRGQICWIFQPVLDCNINSPQLVIFLSILPPWTVIQFTENHIFGFVFSLSHCASLGPMYMRLPTLCLHCITYIHWGLNFTKHGPKCWRYKDTQSLLFIVSQFSQEGRQGKQHLQRRRTGSRCT